MNEIISFKNGIKPSLLLEESQPGFDEMLSFPHVSIHLLEGARQCLFFPDEREKMNWMQRTASLSHTTPAFHKELGLVLGYPPKAVDFFVRRIQCQKEGHLEELERLKAKRVGLHYAGISCNGNVDDLIENVYWLWDTYEVDDVLHVRWDTTFLPVPYREKNVLNTVCEQLTMPSVEALTS
ncbi:hypothetical protein [Laceyella putida]|uniref:Uncharacterized protein n=1 Tax=Laceyella putida TaxID=110101 RepID=A0ABW2RRG9_9BACL